jgi:hypothetical protein
MKDAPPAKAVEIDCARRDHRGIVTHVGGPGEDGRRWVAPLVEVVGLVARNEYRYFVSYGSQQFGVRVENGELVTMIDDGWSVRSLPVCDRAG